MNEKINVRIDVSKIDKSKIISRTFKNKVGENVTVKELSLDIVPLKETKLLKDGDTYQLFKTHFVSIQQTKEEREAKIKSTIIGEGTMFKNKAKSEEEIQMEQEAKENKEEVDDGMPF